jgi:hypothetical protein
VKRLSQARVGGGETKFGAGREESVVDVDGSSAAAKLVDAGHRHAVDRHRILVIATAELGLFAPEVLADDTNRPPVRGIVGQHLLDAAGRGFAEDVGRPVEVERHHGLSALPHLRLALGGFVSPPELSASAPPAIAAPARAMAAPATIAVRVGIRLPTVLVVLVAREHESRERHRPPTRIRLRGHATSRRRVASQPAAEIAAA